MRKTIDDMIKMLDEHSQTEAIGHSFYKEMRSLAIKAKAKMYEHLDNNPDEKTLTQRYGNCG